MWKLIHSKTTLTVLICRLGQLPQVSGFVSNVKKKSQNSKTSDCYWTLSKTPAAGVCAVTSPLTLNTNISRLKKATVLKLPSQMLGLPFPGSAGRLPGGCGGRECRSCLRSEVECVRREGKVGNGRVGSSMAVGMPGESRQSQHESVGHRDWFQSIIKSTETQRPTAAWVTGSSAVRTRLLM